MTVKEAMTNIANEIRDILNFSEKIRLTEIPSHIDTISEVRYSNGFETGYLDGWSSGYYTGEDAGVDIGIDIGYANGFTEGYNDGEAAGYSIGHEEGILSEYDRFWDSFQTNGNRRNYPNGFAGSCWKDDTYNPKYNIIVTSMATNMFYSNTQITSTKVPITIDSPVAAISVFAGCTRLREIPSIKVTEKVPSFSGWFTDCNALTTINFTDDSVIGNSINFQWCPLTPESAWNVVQHLKDVGVGDEYLKYTITFSAAVWEALDEYQRENDLTGGWQFVREYIENWIGWRTA